MTTPMTNSLTPREAKAKLFERGIIAKHYLRPSQLEAYELIKNHPRPFLEAARRWGKTTTLLAYILEQMNIHRGWICRVALPEKDQARKVWIPEIEKMQELAPESHRAVFKTTDCVYTHPITKSQLYLYGVDEGKGKSARGSLAHLIVCDEYGFWAYPEALPNVLAPQVRTTGGKILIASTPSADLGHDYYVKKREAIRDNSLLTKTIFDDETLTDERLEQIYKDCGGKDSTTFKREYLCQEVADPERLVIPEFREDIHVYDSVVRPAYFDAYVGADLGFNDNSALLFGFNDFTSGILYIEDEIVVAGKNSREITDLAKATEREHWGDRPVYLRVSDNEIQQLHDMATLCGYQMVPTRKDDKLAAINSLRLRFSQGKIRIHRRCKNLLFQLKVGLWNTQRSGFLRGENTGHLDAIDALIYLNRNINAQHNPFPATEYPLATHFVNPHFDKARSTEDDTLHGLIPELSRNVF